MRFLDVRRVIKASWLHPLRDASHKWQICQPQPSLIGELFRRLTKSRASTDASHKMADLAAGTERDGILLWHSGLGV